MEFSEWLRGALKQAHLTQKELAEKAGTTEASVSRYLSGKRVPKVSTYKSICAALGKAPMDFVTEKNADMTEREKLKEVYDHYGAHETELRLISEMACLTHQFVRATHNPDILAVDRIKEALYDVHITIDQLEMFLYGEGGEMRKQKIDARLERVNAEKLLDRREKK